MSAHPRPRPCPEPRPESRPEPAAESHADALAHDAPGREGGLVVAAAVVDRLHRPTAMLCAARSYPAEYAGRYELPGGKVDPGESPREALARELMEEISLTVRLGAEVVAPGDSRGPSRPAPQPRGWSVLKGHRMRVWLAEPAPPSPEARLGGAHQVLEWVELERLRELPWLSADIPVIDAVLAALRP